MTQISIVHQPSPATARPPGAPYVVRNGVAIISFQGGLATNKGGPLADGSVSPSSQGFCQAVKEATVDASVRSIVAYVDIYGGSLLGAHEAADALYAARRVKPVTAFSDGAAIGPGYLVAAGAQKVFISGPMVNVGGIGVAAVHTDSSGADNLAGLKRTEITAGRFKSAKTLTPDTHAMLQAQIDYQHSVLVSALAKLRGMSVDKMKALADGRVFIGRQAITAGLVDGFSSLEELIRSPAGASAARPAAPAPQPVHQPSAALPVARPATPAAQQATRPAAQPVRAAVPDIKAQQAARAKAYARQNVCTLDAAMKRLGFAP